MADIKELNAAELENVSGGKLTPEAQAWFDRNRDVLADRLRPKGVLGGIAWAGLMDENPNVLDLQKVKEALSMLIDISDLK